MFRYLGNACDRLFMESKNKGDLRINPLCMPHFILPDSKMLSVLASISLVSISAIIFIALKWSHTLMRACTGNLLQSDNISI